MGGELTDLARILVGTPTVKDDELTGLQTNDVELERASTLLNCRRESLESIFHGMIDGSAMCVDHGESTCV